ELFCRPGVLSAVEEVAIQVRGDIVSEGTWLAHFALPPRQAWDNVFHFCAMLLPFRSEQDIDGWAARHRLPRGQGVPLSQLYELSRRWYGRHLAEDWVKWSVAEAQEIFDQAG